MTNKELKRCEYIYRKKYRWQFKLSESEEKFLTEYINEYLGSDYRFNEVNSLDMSKNIINMPYER